MNAQRAEIMHNIKQARDAAGVRDESAEPIPKPSRPIEVGDWSRSPVRAVRPRSQLSRTVR